MSELRRPVAWVRGIAAGMVVVFVYSNVLAPSLVQASFWEERRKTVQHLRGASSEAIHLASLPTAPSLPTQLLHNLPAPGTTPLRSAITYPLTAKLSPAHHTAYTPLFQALPLQYGTIRSVWVPPGTQPTKTVILMQDAHGNPEAQRNLGKALQALIDQKAIGLVALEGAFDPIDLTPFRTFPHQDTIQKVADYLLREDKISGPIHTAFTSPTAIPPVVGVDHPQHYQANVDAYQRSAALQPSFKTRWAALNRQLAESKQTTFNPNLLAFDTHLQGYRQGRIPLGAHLKFLAERVPDTPPAVDTFLAALTLEQSLNFTQVEQERARLLDALTRTLTEDQRSALIQRSLAFRLGHLGHAEFYRSLQDLCTRQGISLRHYPAMATYLQYVLLTERINADQLFQERDRLERAGYETLTTTSHERKLISESQWLSLVEKLLDFALTPEEWTAYKTLKDRYPREARPRYRPSRADPEGWNRGAGVQKMWNVFSPP